MAINVMKHMVHKWGGNILSIHEGIGPPNRRPKQKNEIFHENIARIANAVQCHN